MSNELPDPTRPRVFAGGVLMGLANLVPGVSGGTMILALGLYDHFIAWVAELTSFRWSRRLIATLAVFAAGLGIAVGVCAGPAVWAVTHHTWVMFSLFLGLTLGGVPMLLRAVAPLRAANFVAIAAGFAAMAAFVFLLEEQSLPQNAVTLFAIGAIASSSMILPGISGSLVLLVFGFYTVIMESLSLSAVREDIGGSFVVLAPFALGVAAGIAGLSNVLKYLLGRFPVSTHGVLLGLLFGSVLPLWPFVVPAHPELLDRQSRKAVTALVEGAEPDVVRVEHGVLWDGAEVDRLLAEYGGKSRGDLKRLSQETVAQRPGVARSIGAVLLLAVGLLATLALAGGGKASSPPAAPPDPH